MLCERWSAHKLPTLRTAPFLLTSTVPAVSVASVHIAIAPEGSDCDSSCIRPRLQDDPTNASKLFRYFFWRLTHLGGVFLCPTDARGGRRL